MKTLFTGFSIICYSFFFGESLALAQFESERIIAGLPAAGVEQFEFGDLDNDGDLDMIVASQDDFRLTWFENLGDGEYIQKNDLSDNVSASKDCIGLIDVDGNGFLDIFSISYSGQEIIWFYNFGNGEFSSQNILPQSVASNLSTFDYDQDGLIDLIVSVGNSELNWYRNLGGSFSSEMSIANIGVSLHEYVDIDNDGDTDLVGKSSSLDITLFENLGASNFATPVSIASSLYTIRSFDLVDLDGDTYRDVVLPQNSDLLWFRNLGSNNFDPATVLVAGVNYVNMGCEDLDNDGDVDIFGVSNFPLEISWIENSGNLSFPLTNLNSLGVVGSTNASHRVEIIDIDSNGYVDIFWSDNEDHFVKLIKNSGAGSFVQGLEIASSFGSNAFVIDINNDGMRDALVSGVNPDLRWIENLDGFNYGSVKMLDPSLLTNNGIRFAYDMNDDQLIDILYHDAFYDEIRWIENLGNQTFGSPQIISNTNTLFAVDQMDFDNDGDLDFIALTTNASTEVELFENLGNGNYGTGVPYATFGTFGIPSSFAFANIDGDTIADVVLGSTNYLLWEERMNGSVTGGAVINSGAVGRVEAGDIDNDGDDDVVFSSQSSELYWVENTGVGFSTPILISNQVNYPTFLKMIDIDVDGDLDLFMIDNYEAYWFENIIGGFGQANYIYGNPTGANQVYDVDFDDLDNDGDIDLLVTSSYFSSWSKLSILKNGILSPYQARGELYYDENQNGIRDSMESGFYLASIESSPTSALAFTGFNGKYYLNFDPSSTGIYQIAPNGLANWGVVSDSSTYTVSIDSNFVFLDSLDFGMFPTVIFDSTQVELISSFPRCNEVINNWITARNTGTTQPSGIIQLSLDPQITFVSSDVTPDSIIGQNVFWHFDSLYFFDEVGINYTAIMPDFQSIGDTLISFVSVESLGFTNTVDFVSVDTISQQLVCAYDPNDKISEPAGEGTEGYISVYTSHLDYTIRFQNTGTDTAFIVRIEDQLDSNLDWSSFDPISSSHPMQVSIFPNGLIEFVFDDIELPDSTTNFLGSQGFVKYRIRPISFLAPNTQILNTAEIYFDQNPAIITNTALNTIDSLAASLYEDLSFSELIRIYPNPFNTTITISSLKKSLIKSVSVYSSKGSSLLVKGDLMTNSATLDLGLIDQGVYLIIVETIDGMIYCERLVKM